MVHPRLRALGSEGVAGEPATARWRRHARWWLAALNVAAATVIVTDLAGLDQPDPLPAVPLWLVLGLFVLVEAAVIQLEIGGRPVVLALRATPMLAGLVYLAPVEVIAAHVIGSTIAQLVRGRPSPTRAAAVVTANAVGTTVAAAVFLTLLPTTGSVIGWWGAACAAVCAANAIATPAAIARWSAHDQPLPPRSMRTALGYGLVASIADASFALTVVVFLRSDATDLWLLTGPALVAAASYRAWVRLHRRHARVEFLYACARLLNGASSGAAMLDDLLSLTRDTLHADQAVLVLDERPDRRLLAAAGPAAAHRLLEAVDAQPLDQRSTLLAGRPSVHLRRGYPVPGVDGSTATVDAVIVRIVGSSGVAGSILTLRTTGRSFETDDVRLLEVLAQSVGGALASRRMTEELEASVADLARLATLVPAADDAVALPVRATPQATAGDPPGAPMAIGIIDGTFAWSRVNEHLCALLGAASPAELVGRRFEVDLVREDVSAAHGLVSRVLRGESRASSLELRFRRTDDAGTLVVSFLARSLVTAGRDPVVLCVLVDVTAARLAEAREHDLAARVDAAILDLTAIRRPETVLAAVLHAMRDVTGSVAAAAWLDPAPAGSPGPAGVDGPDRRTVLAMLAEPDLPRLRVPVEVQERSVVIDLVRGPGDPAFDPADVDRARRLAAQAAVSLENARTHTRALALVAELDAVNAALQEAIEARSRFLAGVSHELRTPVHAILISAQLLGDESAAERDPARVGGLPATIERTGRHLLGLIDDLIDLARMEIRDLRLTAVPLDLGPLLDDVVQQVAPLAADRAIDLTTTRVDGFRIEADPLRIRQVLLNLLGNAIKFTPRGGRVRLAVETRRDEVRISVHDTGTGIASEDLERAFLPFVRLATDGTPGAGLGLPIARRITELHGGLLQATSTPGLGSVFTVHLPALTARLADDPAAASTVVSQGTS